MSQLKATKFPILVIISVDPLSLTWQSSCRGDASVTVFWIFFLRLRAETWRTWNDDLNARYYDRVSFDFQSLTFSMPRLCVSSNLSFNVADDDRDLFGRLQFLWNSQCEFVSLRFVHHVASCAPGASRSKTINALIPTRLIKFTPHMLVTFDEFVIEFSRIRITSRERLRSATRITWILQRLQ